jgi:hypothetical protein
MLARAPQPRRRGLSPRMRRALQVRVRVLEQEQTEDFELVEALYDYSDRVVERYIERQARLRRFRELLLSDGRAA